MGVRILQKQKWWYLKASTNRWSEFWNHTFQFQINAWKRNKFSPLYFLTTILWILKELFHTKELNFLYWQNGDKKSIQFYYIIQFHPKIPKIVIARNKKNLYSKTWYKRKEFSSYVCLNIFY